MSTAKTTVKHAAVYSLASILGKAVGFIMLPFYAHILGALGYGVIGMIDTALTLLMSLLSYGVVGSIVRFYHEEQGEDKKRVISTALTLVAGVSLIAVTVPILFSQPLSRLLFGASGFEQYLILGLVAFFFELSGQAAQTILIIERRSVLFSALGTARLVVGLGLNIVLIVHLGLGLMGYFLASLIGAILFSLIFNLIAIHKCGLGFDRRIAAKIVRFEAPLVPGNLLSFLSRQVEKILVRVLVSLQGVGILEMGYKFPYLITLLVSQPFMRSWHTTRTEIADQEDAPVQLGKMFTIYLFLAMFAGLMLAINVRLILEILTPPAFWPAFRIAQIEVLTLILAGSYYHLYFGLYYAKRTKTISAIRSVCAVIKIGVSAVLITGWGIYGAAWSGCLMGAVQLVWVFRKSQSSYSLALEYSKIVSLTVVAGVIYLALTQGAFLYPVSEQLWSRLSDGTPAAWLIPGAGRRGTEIALNMVIILSFLAMIPMIRDRSSAGLFNILSPFRITRNR